MNANLIFANAEREAHSNLPEGGFMSLLVSPVKSMPRKHNLPSRNFDEEPRDDFDDLMDKWNAFAHPVVQDYSFNE